ncbi:Uncharacterized conserved protein YqhQ [Sporobacter termitidis DSM 10068]|uniref:Uncharacterized conserved protein YqhQ n=1 Tax=Sporobacter termitidis DSM 10068 TaxID=1123282 RepID=A0A1M5YW86_9FIRM|nr:DUF1385 domain-containing protein [Sporobacter termitidis]SHI16259.1 Uncharacterized conserved protein YqhQ [Sporobacter termitidis DSM 10068]
MSEKKENTNFRTSIGGQALIEGVLMRGPKKQAIVVRTEDGLVTKVEDIKLLKDKYPIVGWPIIRGVVNFGASMGNGVRALMFSAEQMPEDQREEPSKLDKWIEKHVGGEKADKLIITLAVVIGIAFSIGLFILLPTFLAGFLDDFIKSSILRNLAEGVLRILIFLAYLWLATKAKDIQRVWAYHGAEHKSIFTYEKGLELTVENARGQSRLHPRCGTSFMFIVMIVSILVFSLATWSSAAVRMLLRLLLLPVVVGLSYELLKLAGRYDNLFTRILSAPGKALQKLTTAEPDDDMLAVALESLKLVIPEKQGEAEW